MKRLLILGAVWALAVARPEQYKEKEDFQFSRSSSDEGSKSGFYGAQRGNMGGNYERAHNMDSLAQNQMSGLVRQVEGELGDGAKTRTGSVYSAANSRGTYGSHHFDLGNLAGRNFQEGTTYGDSQSSLAASSGYNAAAYQSSSNSRSQSSSNSGYAGQGLSTGYSGVNLQSDHLQTLDNTQGANLYDYGRTHSSSHSSGYNAQSGYQQHSAIDSSNANLHSGGYGSNIRTRYITATPVRIIVTPGSRVAIPIAAQSYDMNQGSSIVDQNQNSLNSDAEVLSNDNQRTLYRPSNAKHYESSYQYRKQWEKHDTIPASVLSLTTSTDNPFPRNSELYEDSQAHIASNQYDARRVDSQKAHSSNIYSGYNANVKSASGQSRLNYDTQHNGASSHLNANGYTLAGYNGGSNHQESSSDSSSNAYNIQSQYQSGRYHGAAADSSSLTQTGLNAGFNSDLNSQVENLNVKPKSYQSSYSYHKSWERQGDPYVIKPASSGYYESQSPLRLTAGQHSHQSGADCDENGHIRVARSYNINQYQQSQNMEDLGQQVEDLGQQSQNMEDLGQQIEDLGQKNQNIEDLGQQVEDLGQQNQNMEDLGQQVQDLGQQTQTLWGQQEAGQQAQNTWDNLEDLSQQSHKNWDEIQNNWDKFEDLSQKPQDINKQHSNIEQKNQNDLGQRSQDTEIEQKYNTEGQIVQNKWDVIDKMRRHEENFHTQNQEHESNSFHQQINQPELISGSVNQRPLSLGSNADNNTQQYFKPSEPNINNAGFFNLNNQKEENLFQETHKFYESSNWNLYSNSHRQEQTSHSYSHVNAFEAIPPNPAPISSIWDKLGNIGQQSLLTDIGNVDKSEGNVFSELHTNSHNLYENSRHTYHGENSAQEHFNSEKDISQNKSNDTPTEKEGSQDIGRGDIGPEDLSDLKPNKHPLDTPGNDETAQNNKTNSELPKDELRVISLDRQKSQDKTEQNKYSESLGSINLQIPGQDKLNDFAQNVNLHQQHTEQQSSHVFSLHENIESPYRQDFGQQNLEQQNVQDFGQHNLEKNNIQDFGQQNLDQQNLQDFGQQNLEQQNLQDFGQHNLEQNNIQDFGQKNLEQQNLQDFGQQNLEQQSLHDNLEQQNLKDFDQQNLQDFGQQNLEQQNLQDFNQQNLEQQSLHDNLEQQNLQDFGQHENLGQQNLQDFGQQENLEQQNLQDFAQHENLGQQNLQDFGQQENLGQQNLQDFGQQENLEQQNLQDFAQHENLGQQNLQDFGQQENLGQQNLQDFGQHENLGQNNLQDFDKHYNLEQQNLRDFGQLENSEQQNLQDFGKHDKLEQQNYGQQKHLEQQNLQDFSQQEHLGQQNLHVFGIENGQQQYNKQDSSSKSQVNLEHSAMFDQQNVQDFGQIEHLEQNQASVQNDKHFENENQQATYQKNKVQSQTYFPPTEEIEEIIQVKKVNNDLQSSSPQSTTTEVVPPVEPVTEKTGFWKSVGNKFSRAKSKIASWFQG